MRVAFQGEQGAFSEEAARHLLPEGVETVPCGTFESLFAAIPEDRADLALAPMENTLAGHVTRAYDLLYEYTFQIIAEVIRPIQHCLIVPPGGTLQELRSVQSHPVALAQCERFFSEHPGIKRVVGEDTAGSVCGIMAKGDRAAGAIAGEHAANVYGATVLLRNIEDYPENFTRFALLAPGEEIRTAKGDKYSLAIKLLHQPGSLYRGLEPFARNQVNLVNLLCRPLKRTPWHYLFFADIQAGDIDAAEFAIKELKNLAADVRLLGRYEAAKISKQ